MRHNSFPTNHLSFVSLRSDWLCFARFGPAVPAQIALPALALSCPRAGNWLRLARIGSEYRVYADRTGLSRLKAVLRTVQDRLGDRCASGANLRRRRVPGHSRRNPLKLWSLICGLLFCCYIIIRARQFLVKRNLRQADRRRDGSRSVERTGTYPARRHEMDGDRHRLPAPPSFLPGSLSRPVPRPTMALDGLSAPAGRRQVRG